MPENEVKITRIRKCIEYVTSVVVLSEGLSVDVFTVV